MTVGFRAVAVMCMAMLTACSGIVVSSSQEHGREVPVCSFDLLFASCGRGMSVRPRASVDGGPLSVAGLAYTNGFGTRPESAVAFSAKGKVLAFDALVGIDDSAKAARLPGSYGQPTARFRVWADDKIVFDSGDRKLGQKPLPGQPRVRPRWWG